MQSDFLCSVLTVGGDAGAKSLSPGIFTCTLKAFLNIPFPFGTSRNEKD